MLFRSNYTSPELLAKFEKETGIKVTVTDYDSNDTALAKIEAGAAGVHYEDQLASEKKCGHLGGKVLVPTDQFVRTLTAARLASDVLDVPTVLVARTDALAATLDHLGTFAHLSGSVPPHLFDLYHDATLGHDDVRTFLERENPQAFLP